MNELEIVQHPQIQGLSLFFDTIDYRTPHVHPEWELLWLLENPLAVTCSQTGFLLQPGQIALFGPNEPHELHKLEASSTFLCLQLSPALLPWLPPMAMGEHVLHQRFSPAEMEQLRRSLSEIARSYLGQAPRYELWCAGQSLLLLHRILERLDCRSLTPEEDAALLRRNQRLQRLIAFVDENYMHKIRLSDFAQAEGCSLSYLSRFIKSTMNQSFQDYVASVRFHCACRLIAEGNTKMLAVCLESGFSDYRYFSRVFRQRCGMTPEAFARSSTPLQTDPRCIPRSLHSVERFYSTEESLHLAEQYLI